MQGKRHILHYVLAIFLSLALLLFLVSLNTYTVYAASYSAGTYTVSHPNGSNVRSMASTSGKINGVSVKGTTFTVSRVSGEWGYTSSIKTTKGTKSGWINLRYCTKKVSAPVKTTISFSAMSNIDTITKGKSQHISGTIKVSNSKIYSVKAEVINISSNKIVLTKTVYPNAYSYSIYNSALDNGITFGSLAAGNYKLVYRVKTRDDVGDKTYIDTFYVKAKDVPRTITTKTSSSSDTGYKDYYVVSGFNKKYKFNQLSYSRFVSESDGRNKGCTAVSACMAISITKGKFVNPATYPWHSNGCCWEYCKKIGSKGENEYLKQIAEQLKKNNAVAMWANDSHAVCAIGVRKNADWNKLKASDILIIDPYGGKITTLDKAERGGYRYTGCKFYIAA